MTKNFCKICVCHATLVDAITKLDLSLNSNP